MIRFVIPTLCLTSLVLTNSDNAQAWDCDSETYTATACYDQTCYCDCRDEDGNGDVTEVGCGILAECPNGNGIYCTKETVDKSDSENNCDIATEFAQYQAREKECGPLDNFFCTATQKDPSKPYNNDNCCTVSVGVTCTEDKSKSEGIDRTTELELRSLVEGRQ